MPRSSALAALLAAGARRRPRPTLAFRLPSASARSPATPPTSWSPAIDTRPTTPPPTATPAPSGRRGRRPLAGAPRRRRELGHLPLREVGPALRLAARREPRHRLASAAAAAAKLIELLLAPDKAGNQHALARRMGVEELIWDCSYWGAGAATSPSTTTATPGRGARTPGPHRGAHGPRPHRVLQGGRRRADVVLASRR